tara:strand:+ start:160 stop:615 length:456 start_codon:yes stop_codon:yes gene_type:complete
LKGTILQFDAKRGQGLISGQDGARYPFQGVEFQNAINELAEGVDVDFEVIGEEARSIFVVKDQYIDQSEAKSKLAAGLFAILLGGLGVHKFYLGHTIPGVILLLVSVFGWVLMFIPNLVVGVIVLIEGIIYLTKSDKEFQKTYVIDKKVWF